MAIRVVVVGADEVAAHFANQPARMRVLEQTMEAHLALLHAAVVPLTPVGVTSALRGSWQTRITPGLPLRGVLGSPLPHASVMERGRRPGARMPPPDALRVWVERKIGPGVDAWVIARSIGRKGIEGRHMLEQAIALTRPLAERVWDAGVARALAES